MVAYNNKKYYIDIIESKPANAISIIETDCEVDFAPPLDYKEPERVTPPPVSVPPSSQGTVQSWVIRISLSWVLLILIQEVATMWAVESLADSKSELSKWLDGCVSS